MGKARTLVRFPTVPSATGHDWSGVVPIGVWGAHHSSRRLPTTALVLNCYGKLRPVLASPSWPRSRAHARARETVTATSKT